MRKDFCDRCGKETVAYPDTTVDIRWDFMFFNRMKNYELCKECAQKLRNLVVEFLGQ